MKITEIYRKHLIYCSDNNLKPVSISNIRNRIKIGLWSDDKAIKTANLGHGGARRSQRITIKDEYNARIKNNKVKCSYQTYRNNYWNKTLDKLLKRLCKTM